MTPCACDPSSASLWQRLRWRFHRYWLEDSIFHLLSEKWFGNDMVPLDHRTLITDDHGCDRVFSFLNDSFEIGVGFRDEWHTIIRREAIHRFIWWYLCQWSLGEWFGLRRWIWYKLLRRRCERWNRHSLRMDGK